MGPSMKHHQSTANPPQSGQCTAFDQLDEMMEDILENEMPMCAFAFAPPPPSNRPAGPSRQAAAAGRPGPSMSHSDGHICAKAYSKRLSSRKFKATAPATAMALRTSQSYHGAGGAAMEEPIELVTCSCGQPASQQYYAGGHGRHHRQHPHHACSIL